MKALDQFRQLVSDNKLDYSHYTLARFVLEVQPKASELDLWLLVLSNIEISQGNVCLDLSILKEKISQLDWPGLPDSRDLLKHLPHSVISGSAHTQQPLVHDLNRLYLKRYYLNECYIAEQLLHRRSDNAILTHKIKHNIDQLFPVNEEIDYQKLAAIVSSLHHLCIISGGPGTGKTWTVSKIMALLLMQQKEINIKLAAPTGKAAARLSESIMQLQQGLELEEDIKQRMPVQALTLHRLLGFHRYTHLPRYNREHKLDCDVLVVDEASMIDQQMMAQLCDALPTHCKLILLGDKDQLSSVEAGSVFADLCGGLTHSQFTRAQVQLCKQLWNIQIEEYQQDYALADHVVVLTKSHRFDDRSAIGRLATLINQGNTQASIELLKQASEKSLSWWPLVDHQIKSKLDQEPLHHALSINRARSIQQAFTLFHEYQVLAAVWNGAGGVNEINNHLQKRIKKELCLSQEREFYQGLALMMTTNAYQFDIHNGDIGIVWPDQKNELKIWFEQGSEFRELSLSQCPQHKTAYAMTVHKAQGSEFGKVILILPSSEVAVATRELFYTGITRASSCVECWASEAIVKTTIQHKTQRESGLMQRLNGHS